MSEPLPSASPTHQQLLRDLHHDLAERGLLESPHFWRWKLAFWVPTFFASYLALLLLPFGPLWLLIAPVASVAILTMGFVGHDAGHYALSRKCWINDVWGQFA